MLILSELFSQFPKTTIFVYTINSTILFGFSSTVRLSTKGLGIRLRLACRRRIDGSSLLSEWHNPHQLQATKRS